MLTDTPNAQWTESRVRDELPDVLTVDEQGTERLAWLSGRKLPYATATIRMSRSPGDRETIDVTIGVAWSTLARCLNLGRPLRI